MLVAPAPAEGKLVPFSSEQTTYFTPSAPTPTALYYICTPPSNAGEVKKEKKIKAHLLFSQ